MSPAPATCDPDIEIATATEFLLRNKKKANNFTWGELESAGHLSFIVENLPKDGSGCPGGWMFDAMMGHIGAAVQAIRGNWTYGDNLAAVNRLTASGIVSLADAARQTRTGRCAGSWEYTIVQVLPQSSGTAGAYTRVYALFKK
ncbi:MAG: hypothetical protein K2R98_31270 [Gemmataceae bacterium]|nr:hypothetical protein [Gemmataceae bacterium]